MKTIRRMIYREVLQKVGFATLGFIGLFFSLTRLKNCGWWGKDHKALILFAMPCGMWS